MAKYYDKEELKQKLEIEQIYDLLEYWGGEPEYTNQGLVSQTICHNPPGVGSRKLYYYENEGVGLFACYTGCDERSFDVFQLAIKVAAIQNGKNWDLYDAMDFIASYFGFEGNEQEKRNDEEILPDWEILQKHSRYAGDRTHTISTPSLTPINSSILASLPRPHIQHWENEGISPSVIFSNNIGYYPTQEQISIPHYDVKGTLIGIRGRALGVKEAERYGKYRPLQIGSILYAHPLSMNLYHLNRTKENVRRARAAVVFESEKSCLLSETYYGSSLTDISCSCCGSSISRYQIDLLRECGVQEIIIAFDRDFEEINDKKFRQLKFKLITLNKKYGNYLKITVLFDSEQILPIHASPIDAGKEVFEYLLKRRFIPKED